MSAGASPQTPLGSLQRSPRSPSWFQVATSRQEGNGGKDKDRGGEGKIREKGMGKEGKREKFGNSALVVGGIDAPAIMVQWLQTKVHASVHWTCAISIDAVSYDDVADALSLDHGSW